MLHLFRRAVSRLRCILPSVVAETYPSYSDSDRAQLTRPSLYSGKVLRKQLSSSEFAGKHKEDVMVIYKGRWMVPFYVLVRLKVIQLVGLAALVLPINTYLQNGVMDNSVLISSGLVVIGCGIASNTLWYFSKRYVGALALLGIKKDIVRFSVMNFWGTRTEEEYSLDSVIPPLRGLNKSEKAEMMSKVLVPIDVIGGRQYFLSIKHGHIFNKEMLIRLLDGSHLRTTYFSEEE